jgi:hypothetical protein
LIAFCQCLHKGTSFDLPVRCRLDDTRLPPPLIFLLFALRALTLSCHWPFSHHISQPNYTLPKARHCVKIDHNTTKGHHLLQLAASQPSVTSYNLYRHGQVPVSGTWGRSVNSQHLRLTPNSPVPPCLRQISTSTGRTSACFRHRSPSLSF